MSLWGNKDAKTSTGTVAIAANGLVTGTDTLFDTEARAGDYLIANNKKHLIRSITSNTAAHVADAGVIGGTIGVVDAANAYSLQEMPKFVSASLGGVNANNVFGVDATEIGIAGGILALSKTGDGSGYFANAVVTISGGGGADGAATTTANSIGRIAAITLTNAGTGYKTIPAVAIAAPAAQAFNANTAVAANGFVGIATNVYQVSDLVTYAVAEGNTALAELSSGSQYYIQAANTTGVYLAATSDGDAIELTKGLSETGHTLQGETATAVGTGVSGGVGAGVAHTGWVKRTVGTGNKSGRIFTEVLVAGSIVSDADDDTFFPE